jgi:modulator of FtsH protease HflK
VVEGGKRQRGPSLEDLLRRTGGGKGGGFGGMPKRADGKSWWPIIIGALVALWIVFTSVHRIGPEQEGVVTQLGKYARTVQPGIQLTLPSPIESITKIDTQQIQTTAVGSPKASSENLVLTRDQSIIDMAYDVRWSIKDPELYLFQLDSPDGTVKEVAESAMRAAVANYDLTQAIGPGRGAIELEVRRRMQQVLDEYRAGVLVQSISIRQSDPPAEVNDAFREVNAAQQRRESYMNDARAYASRVTELALGETAEFDKIYVQYREAPEVTKRRLYYETMEQVLGKVDKTIVESNGVVPYLPIPGFPVKTSTKAEPVTVTGTKQ